MIWSHGVTTILSSYSNILDFVIFSKSVLGSKKPIINYNLNICSTKITMIQYIFFKLTIHTAMFAKRVITSRGGLTVIAIATTFTIFFYASSLMVYLIVSNKLIPNFSSKAMLGAQFLNYTLLMTNQLMFRM